MDTKLYEVVKVVEKPSNVGQHFEEYKSFGTKSQRYDSRELCPENWKQYLRPSINLISKCPNIIGVVFKHGIF